MPMNQKTPPFAKWAKGLEKQVQRAREGQDPVTINTAKVLIHQATLWLEFGFSA